MPRFYPVTRTVTVTVGGGGGPTAKYAEDVNIGDDLVVKSLLADDVNIGDDLVVKTLLADDVTVDDALSVTVLPKYAEDVNINDLLKTTIAVTDTGRSGTPASDLLQETMVQQSNPAVNFGNASPTLVQAATALNADATRTMFEIDLTKFAGMVSQAVAAPFTLTMKASTSGLVATAMQYDLYRHTAKPFVEDTVTWNDNPGSALGTAIVTAGSVSINTTLTTFTITMTEAQLNSSLTDGWVYLVFRSTGTVLRPIFSITAREGGTAADRPTLDLLLQRGT